MLIPSHRHRAADLRLWADYEAADAINAASDRLNRKVAEAMHHIREFVSLGTCYCGVSWGKDSVVVAHLCRSVDPTIPLIHLRPSNHNSDCDTVRDAYFAAYPGQTYSEELIDYGNLHALPLTEHVLDVETDILWYSTIRRIGKPFGHRHILGLRSEESSKRSRRERIHGASSKNGCAPITRWTHVDVFAYLYANQLPVHPAYAMLGGGRWRRNLIRVAEIGDTPGRNMGRLVWEKEYYGDILRRIESGRPTWF